MFHKTKQMNMEEENLDFRTNHVANKMEKTFLRKRIIFFMNNSERRFLVLISNELISLKYT